MSSSSIRSSSPSQSRTSSFWLFVSFLLLGLSPLVLSIETVNFRSSNIESDVKYDVFIQPHKHSEAHRVPMTSEGGTFIDMISPEDGEQYRCFVPDPVSENDSQTSRPKITKSPAYYLDNMGACLYRLGGWWTYEFCRGAHVRQFHQEEKQVIAEFFLGRDLVEEEEEETESEDTNSRSGSSATTHAIPRKEEDNTGEGAEVEGLPLGILDQIAKGLENWKPVEETEEEGGQETKELPQQQEETQSQEESPQRAGGQQPSFEKTKYYTERYIDGTPCDLNGKPREVTVRYMCSESSDKSFIADITEPATCQYLMTIATPLLCTHPDFRPKKETVLRIECYIKEDEDEVCINPESCGDVPSTTTTTSSSATVTDSQAASYSPPVVTPKIVPREPQVEEERDEL